MASWTEDTRRFLEAQRVGHLATAGADGAPHVIPVCYALDDDALYFVADAKPKRRPARLLERLRNLRANPRAAVVVDAYDDDWTRLRWVLVRGPATILDDPAAHARALGLLRARYPQYRAMSLDDAHAHPIVRIDAERVSCWRARGPQ
jgi:PPOX class probable F420-dependent enzyme